MNSIERQARRIWDTRTKIPGSLGKLEDIAVKFCKIQNTLKPEIKNPVLALAAASHGVARQGVTSSSLAVTKQMKDLFARGNGSCAVMCRDNGIRLDIIDVGIDKGTNDFTKTRAMSVEKVHELLDSGREYTKRLKSQGTNTVLIGEMGVGNTTCAAVLMSAITGMSAKDCSTVNADNSVYKKKLSVISSTVRAIKVDEDIYELCSRVGGFEILFLSGIVLGAYENRMALVNDGFTTTVAVLIATVINPKCIKNVVFSHYNGERCHKNLLDYFNAEYICKFDMRLGEGTGAIIALPVIKQALSLFNDLESFRDANVDCDPHQKKLPIALGTTSYIFQDDILENVDYLKDKVDDIEIVLFESKEESNIPSEDVVAKLKKIAKANNLSYTIHLPYDVKACSRNEEERKHAVETWLKVIKLTRDLPVHGFIVHLEPDCYETNQVSDNVKVWTQKAKKSMKELKEGINDIIDPSLICIETLSYDIKPYLDDILKCGFSLTLDVGHLFLNGLYSNSYIESLIEHTRIIHLHGVNGKKKDHVSLSKHFDKKQLEDFISLLSKFERIPVVLTLEIFSESDFESSMKYLKSKGIF